MRTPWKLFHDPKSDRWYVEFQVNGRRVRKSTKQKDKAKAHEVAKRLALADATYHAANATTLDAAARYFVAALTNAKRSPETQRFYSPKLAHLGRVIGADTALTKITAATADDYIETRLSEGASRHTVAKELGALRGILKLARRRGEFDRDPAQVLPVSFASGYEPRKRRITIQEAWSLIHELPDAAARYVALVCGTTARDAAARRAKGSDRTPEGIIVRDLKTALATRTVPVVSLTRPFVDFAFRGLGPNDRVFSVGGTPHEALNRATKRLGWSHLSPNDLRRSVAHWLLEAGVRRDLVSAFLGHASTRMLDAVYGRLDTGEIGRAIQAVFQAEQVDSGDAVEQVDFATQGK